MKKIFLLTCFLLCIICLTGCEFDSYIDSAIDDATKPNVSCTIDKQYSDTYSYYVEGTCKNNGSKDYDYLQVEFICYDKEGNNLGTALANTNNLLSGQTWKYKAMDLVTGDEKIDHCDYHEVTGW